MSTLTLLSEYKSSNYTGKEKDSIHKFLELLNGGLGLALLILVIVIIRDYKKEFFSKTLKFRLFAAFLLLSIVIFSIKELYEYGPFDFIVDTTIEELLETLYMLLTIAAAFIMMGMRK